MGCAAVPPMWASTRTAVALSCCRLMLSFRVQTADPLCPPMCCGRREQGLVRGWGWRVRGVSLAERCWRQPRRCWDSESVMQTINISQALKKKKATEHVRQHNDVWSPIMRRPGQYWELQYSGCSSRLKRESRERAAARAAWPNLQVGLLRSYSLQYEDWWLWAEAAKTATDMFIVFPVYPEFSQCQFPFFQESIKHAVGCSWAAFKAMACSSCVSLVPAAEALCCQPLTGSCCVWKLGLSHG